MTNREIAKIFEKTADMLAIRGDNFHRVLAYRRAAEGIRELNRDLNQIQAEGQLTEIPGIGTTLAEKIEEMLTTGRLEFYDRLSEEIPPSLVEMLWVEGVGPKRVKQIYDALGITTLEELTEAAKKGKLQALPGMGAKSEAKIVAGINALDKHGDERLPLGVAWPIANEILNGLRALPGVKKAAVAGSLRRMRETIGDVDLLVAVDDPEPIMNWFCQRENVESVLGKGSTKSSVVLLNGLKVELLALPEERWGTLLSYFTGNKEHNVRMRELALKQGLSLNEHSYTRKDGGDEILCSTEAQVYAMLDMPCIPAVLRENRGEIEAAKGNRLPSLVETRDIIGDLHVHSTWSDGRRTILEMAETARARGLEYLVIADHSVSLGIANGLSIERLRQQTMEIQAADETMGSDFRVLQGIEMEIRADGNLDFPDEVLAELDFVIASLHVGLRQPREQIMDRFMTALENPYVDMIAHPSGRLIPDRQAADVDIEVLLTTAFDTGTIIEINANPQRLDLRDIYVSRAIELGVKLAINTDAHNTNHFDFLHFGIATAQRGWATAADIANSWPLKKLLVYLGK